MTTVSGAPRLTWARRGTETGATAVAGSAQQSVRALADAESRANEPSWLAVFLFWTAIGLVESVKSYAGWRIPTIAPSWRYVLVANMPWWYLWALLTPVVFRLSRRFPLDANAWPAHLAVHAVAAMGVASAHLFAEGFVYWHTTSHVVIPDLPTQWRRFFDAYLMTDLVTYACLLGGYHAFILHGRYRESALREAQAETRAARLRLGLAEARMHALRMELNPHFLFNTLNAIVALVRRQENARADAMLVRLGDLLRATLAPNEGAEIPLRREIALLSLYLDIERVRFADRLAVEIAIDPDVADALVPPLLLQPLVENAIRHGISRSTAPGRVRIAARREGDVVAIDVSDTGADEAPGEPSWRASAPRDRAGVGLSNIRSRLREMYGEASAGLVLARDAGGGTTARLTLPHHLHPVLPAAGDEDALHDADGRMTETMA